MYDFGKKLPSLWKNCANEDFPVAGAPGSLKKDQSFTTMTEFQDEADVQIDRTIGWKRTSELTKNAALCPYDHDAKEIKDPLVCVFERCSRR